MEGGGHGGGLLGLQVVEHGHRLGGGHDLQANAAAGNLGGGGFLMIRRSDGETEIIDYRERAYTTATAAEYAELMRQSFQRMGEAMTQMQSQMKQMEEQLKNLPQSPGAFLLEQKDVARPLWQVLAGGGARLRPEPALAAPEELLDAEGRLIALPIGRATPVLYYNRDAFRFARLDPTKPPATSTSPMRTSTLPRRMCACTPDTEDARIWLASEPTATGGGMPMKIRSGVIRKPPPTPNRDEMTPTSRLAAMEER